MSAVAALVLLGAVAACGTDIESTEVAAASGATTAPPSPPPPPPPPGDTTAPSAPGTLAAAADGSTAVNLSWQASTDNVGVTSYAVERCQGAGCSAFIQIASTTVTSLTNTGLSADTSYGYRVRAVDAAGNLSAYSNTASATTTPAPPPPPADTTPPTAPSALNATASGSGGMNLSWQPSSDNVAVTGYRVERCQGSGCSSFIHIASTTVTSFNDSGLTAATTYRYLVRATDAAGNLSASSNVATGTTDSGPTPPPPPATLPAWVAALAPGQWFQIPSTAMSSVEPFPTPSGNTGPQSKVIAWTSFVVDTRTSKVYSVANGGHNDYAGNEVDELDLERPDPQWIARLAPTSNAQLTNCQSYYADGRPVSRHSYYGVTLNEFNDRLMLFGGAHWCVNGNFHSAISSYNIGANSYNGPGTHPNIGSGFAGVAAYAANPATGDVYGARGSNFGRWNRASNTWTTLSPSGQAPGGDEAMSAYDTTRNRILFAGGLGNDNRFYNVGTNSFTSAGISGASAGTVTSADGAAMVYIPAIDRYLVRTSGGGGTVHQIDAGTMVATTYSTAGGGSVPSTQNGPYNKFLYVPRLRGCIYVPTYSGNAWFLRVH